MPSVRFEASCPRGSTSAIEDVRLACAMLLGAVQAAEMAIASSAFPSRVSTTQTRPWSPSDLAVIQQLRRVGAACVEFERALAQPAKTMGIVNV
jgi:hypothetical protein